ncbi:hypothetical protein VSDG_01637 [Cytospora chrysosperma]|uniref:Uncharacterized protein n=1 Tax=Cytospora chrysosperma TaxID=252740 RepID=A0A423WHL3_CYTCH|nr:hypothetical protein VSDG_01637 [Valsa sordida]
MATVVTTKGDTSNEKKAVLRARLPDRQQGGRHSAAPPPGPTRPPEMIVAFLASVSLGPGSEGVKHEPRPSGRLATSGDHWIRSLYSLGCLRAIAFWPDSRQVTRGQGGSPRELFAIVYMFLVY